MRFQRVVVSAILCVVGSSFTFAQSVPPPPPPSLPIPSPQSAVHVTTRIVQVSVTVHDDRGRPVTGLTKDDFVLLDDGKRQQITSVTEQNNRLTTTAATSPPNLFTNKFEQGVAQPLLTVVVIDVYNGRYWDAYPKNCGGKCPPICVVGSMFQQIEKFISKMQLQDRVALYVLAADDLYLMQDFTGDPDALKRALVRGKEHIPVSFARSQVESREMDAHTMDAMRVISNRLHKLPGRKNLIWLSTGFPPDSGLGRGALNSAEKIAKTAQTLGDADFPLFAIDATGLTAQPRTGNLGGGAGGGGGGGGIASGVEGPTPSSSGGSHDCTTQGRPPQLTDFDYSKDLAEQSGGRAYYDTNDFAGAVRKAIDDSASTYILNYYPDHNKWNGEFREIKVKVNRSGLEVRARKGYYAVADTASATEHDSQKLADAIKSPLESTDLGFDVQADGIEVAGVRQLKVKVTLDATQLRFQQQGERRTDSLSETWAEFSAVGQQVGEISKTIDLSRSQDDYKKLLRDGFTYSKTLVLAKDAVEVRLILRDTGNGAIGSVIIPLTKLFPANSAPTAAEHEKKQ
jgi:VWFA-related protein